MANDLAAGGVEHGPMTITQLYAGDAPIISGQGVAVTAIAKHSVAVLLANGDVSNATSALADGAKCVIAMQAAEIGQAVPYQSGGFFNHAALTGWPTAIDTLAERKQFFMGTDIHIGAIQNAG